MIDDNDLQRVFQEFLDGADSADFLKNTRAAIKIDDVPALLDMVESLGDPGDYCKDDYDQATPAGYFLYIDFVSWLIIELGDEAIDIARNRQGTRHHFVRWIVRFTTDSRFHDEISQKFAYLTATSAKDR